MNKILLCFSMLFLVQSALAKEVYQCKVNDSTVFQGKPCAGTGKTVADRVAEDKAKTQKLAAIKTKNEIQQKNWESMKPKIGMTKTEAYKSSWGYPDKENVTTNAYGVNEQWVYRGYYGNDKYLYFKNGILTSISE